MITLIFHSTPTFANMRKAMNDLQELFEDVEEPQMDMENDNFYFTLDTDREHGMELSQSLTETGHHVSVKYDVNAFAPGFE